MALPGIRFGGGDLDRPVVRGGGPDDNLYVLDGIPLPDVFHELSDSIISGNVIRTFDLHSAAFPARFGEATGGVIDIALRDPATDRTELGLDLSQLKSGAYAEGPITPDLSAYGSYRVNLAHLFLKRFERNNGLLAFLMPKSSDYTARAQWRIADLDISVTMLGARDEVEEVQRGVLPSPPRFGQRENRKLDAQSIRIRYGNPTDGALDITGARILTSRKIVHAAGDTNRLAIDGLSLRGDYNRHFDAHELYGGINLQTDEAKLSFAGSLPLCDYFEQQCGQAQAASGSSRRERFSLIEGHAGIRLAVTEHLTLDSALRVRHDMFLNETGLEPRVGIEWRRSENFTLFARGGRHHRRAPLERLLLGGAASQHMRSQESWQAAMGQRVTLGGGFTLQTEAWYKNFELSDLPGTPIATSLNRDAFGIDLLLAKPLGRNLSGWVGLGHAQFGKVKTAQGAEFTFPYDSRWNGTLALNFRPGNDWQFGGKFRFQSGARFTPLSGVRLDPTSGFPVAGFAPLFSGHLPDYRRLDVRVEKGIKIGGVAATLYIDVLNVLDSDNVSRRTFPLRNAYAGPDGAGIVAEEENGVPRFVAFGINLRL